MRPLTAASARYLNPTRTSLNKTKDPTGIRQKVSELDSALNQINMQLEVDQNKTENLERKQFSQSDKLQKQVLALRQAFDTLADSVMEETEKIRRDVVEELRTSTTSSFASIEQLQTQLHKSEEDRVTSLVKTQGVLKEMKQQVSILIQKQNKHDQNFHSIQDQFQNFQIEILKQIDDLKSKLEISDKTLSQHWKLNEQLSVDLEALDLKQKNNWDQILDAQTRIFQLEEGHTNKTSEFQHRIIDLEQFAGTMTSQCRILQENATHIRDSVDTQINNLKMEFRDKIEQIEDHTSDIKNELFRKSTRGVDEAVQLISKDIKALIERLVFLEENHELFRKEALQQLGGMENNQMNKIEALNRQYYTLARGAMPSYSRDLY